MPYSLVDLIDDFAAKDAEIAFYREKEWLIVDARDSLVDDNDIAKLARLKEFDRLVDLNLAGSKITNHSMDYLTRCLRLESLDVGRTQCDETCLKSLVEISSLKGLGISKIRVSKYFVNLLQLPQLDVLDLSQSYPARDDVRSVVTSTNVSSLNLSGNGFQQDDFTDLDVLSDTSRIVSIVLDDQIRVVVARPKPVRIL